VKDVEHLIDSIVILDHDNVLLNASTQEISQKLYFSFDIEKNDEAIYSEMMPGGFINVSLNQGEFESNILVEPLFNAAINNKSLFKKIFDN
jgi:ABC-2 type transport system ATP-binding protein